MITEYTIENFKAFSGPATVPIKPITLIFGPNSSGKSSIFQSMLMFKQTIEDYKDYTAKNPVLLPKGNFVDLGSYREFIFNHDINKKVVFKIKAKHPKYLVYQGPEFFDYNRIDLCTVLENSISNEDIGLSLGFQNTNSGEILLSDVQLFVGPYSDPIVSYACVYPQGKTQPDLPGNVIAETSGPIYEEARLLTKLNVTKINDDHPYWLRYCEQLEKFEGYAKSFREDIRKIPEDEKRELLKKYGISSHIMTSEIGESDSEKLSKQEALLVLEKYKKEWRKDFLLLKHFLPNTLYFQEIGELQCHFSDGDSAINISLVTLSIAHLIRDLFNNIIHIGPLRNYPERYFAHSGFFSTQVGETGEYTPNILITNDSVVNNVNSQFDRLGLGYHLKVSSLSKEAEDIYDLYTIRLLKKDSGIHVGITDVGIGVSQVLPIIVQCVLSTEKTLLIEQPELHLHPAQQAELGDVFIESALGENKNTLLIETHSEHLILRIMRRIRETYNGNLPEGLPAITPNDVTVLYVEPDGKNGSIIREMPLNERGELVKAWPGGFFEEGLREVLS